MPRPPRDRAVRAGLTSGLFGPRGRPKPGAETVELAHDGLEALRLVDLEGLYQEAAAERMDISRATLARILTDARRTVTDALIHQKVILLGGGAVRPRDERGWPCPVHGHRRRRGRGCRCDGEGRGGGRKESSDREETS